METRWKLVLLLKVLFQVALVFVFLKFFGLSCWKRYLSEDVYVSRSESYSSRIKAPGVTVCPGLRSGHTDLLAESCVSRNGTSDIVSCIEAASYDLSSTVLNVEEGNLDESEQKPLDATEWTLDFVIETRLKIMQTFRFPI